MDPLYYELLRELYANHQVIVTAALALWMING